MQLVRPPMARQRPPKRKARLQYRGCPSVGLAHRRPPATALKPPRYPYQRRRQPLPPLPLPACRPRAAQPILPSAQSWWRVLPSIVRLPLSPETCKRRSQGNFLLFFRTFPFSGRLLCFLLPPFPAYRAGKRSPLSPVLALFL